MPADAFLSQLLQLGVGGVDLKRSIDLVSPLRLARMLNVARNEEGRLQTRPGQRRLAWVPGARVHSLARIQAALEGGEYIRLAGADGSLYAGREGLLTELADGFSGQPLSIVPGRPRLSGDSWALVGDSAKNVKVRAADNLVMPLGLAPPEQAALAVPGSDHVTIIDQFEGTPGGDAGWTANQGSAASAVPTQAFSSDPTVPAPQGATALQLFFGNFGEAVGTTSYQFVAKAYDLDLSKLTGITGVIDATDDDQFHLWVRIRFNTIVNELRIYFVVSDNFNDAVLPGTNPIYNTDAYVKSFIPSQFTSMLEAFLLTEDTLSATVAARQLSEELEAQTERQGEAKTIAEGVDEERASSSGRFSAGAGGWTEFGTPGRPLRRGEFLRIGADPDASWATVKGIVIYCKSTVGDAATGGSYGTTVRLDDFYLRGGYSLDSSAPSSVAYDWRYRHYDPRTGALSRFSPIMSDEKKLDLLRQTARVTPQAYGDSNIRQLFYRRGGTLPSDWYFVGINQSDGGCGKDNMSDATAANAGVTVDDDYHQPVTTVDRDGTAIYAQPLPILFGPLQGLTFGLGDPYRPGHVYWSLPDEPDHWPLGNRAEVCSPEEELMSGCVFGGNAFAISRRAFYPLLVNITSGSVIAASPTCVKGLAARHALVVGLDGIYFVSTDGVWKTTGGTPQNLSDDFIESLFRGETKNGYPPIDWRQASQIRLHMHLTELWLHFIDTSGEQQVWVYSLIFQFWRHYKFAWPIAAMLSEGYEQSQLLLGAAAAGRIYVHDGLHDDGLAIASLLRTGALHQGMPRQDKLYGDVELEMDLKGVNATLTVYYGLEKNSKPAVLIVPKVGPAVYLVDPFGSVPLQATDVSLELGWSSFTSSPWVGRGGPSFVPQPESSIGRLTEWDNLGSPTNKIVKGLLIEANTFGFTKQLQVMTDGGNVAQRTVSLTASGRQFQHLVFSDGPIEARLVRLVPADTSPWLPYEIRWLFDTDPLELTLWETQPIDHGIHTVHELGESWITTKSTTDITLTITVLLADGTMSMSEAVTIPSTGGEKHKQYVKLPTLKGVLFKYSFSSSAPHRLYREESIVHVWPWGGDQPVPVQPFGTDDLDVTRVVRDAEGTGVRGQRWLDTSAKAGQ